MIAIVRSYLRVKAERIRHAVLVDPAPIGAMEWDFLRLDVADVLDRLSRIGEAR